MASYDFDSNCSPLFKGTNYFLWQETMQFYVKHKDLKLWEIMVYGPIVIDKVVRKIKIVVIHQFSKVVSMR